MDFYNTIRSLNPLDNILFSDLECNYHKDAVITSDLLNEVQVEIDKIQKEFYPNTCTADGLLSAWEEFTDSKRYYLDGSAYSDEQKRQIITGIFVSIGGFNRRAFEVVFEIFGYTIVYESADDNIDGSTVRIEENTEIPFRADYGRSGPSYFVKNGVNINLDRIYDTDYTDNIFFYTYSDQNNDILALLEDVKCLDTNLTWVKLT